MVDQTSVNGRATAKALAPGSEGLGGVAEFVDDLSTLAELQAKLAAIDLRDSAKKAAVPFVITLLGLGVGVSGILVALLGSGMLIASALKIQQGWAMVMTAGAAIAFGGLLAGVGGMRLSQSFDSFRRSRKQLWVNLGWVRTVLVSTTSTRSRPRHRS